MPPVPPTLLSHPNLGGEFERPVPFLSPPSLIPDPGSHSYGLPPVDPGFVGGPEKGRAVHLPFVCEPLL